MGGLTDPLQRAMPDPQALEEARRRLDEIKLIQKRRAAGVATNAELREHLRERLEHTKRLLDRLENGETRDQEIQRQDYLREHAQGKEVLIADVATRQEAECSEIAQHADV
jgi:siroheme synthase (precorrin-2 oxidase/ferrochelatase)